MKIKELNLIWNFYNLKLNQIEKNQNITNCYHCNEIINKAQCFYTNESTFNNNNFWVVSILNKNKVNNKIEIEIENLCIMHKKCSNEYINFLKKDN